MSRKHKSKGFPEKPTFFRFFPSSSSKRDYAQRSNVYIFIDDLNLGVMPLRFLRRENEAINAEITGSDVEAASGLLKSLSDYDGRDQTDLICKVVSNIVRELLYSGRSYYQITFNNFQYYLNYFTSFGVSSFFGLIWQIVPKADREWLKSRGALTLKSRILIIEIPELLGGTRGYLKLIKELAENSDLLPTRLGGNMVEKLNECSFNSAIYYKNKKIHLHSILSVWGGIQRDFSLEDVNEFYLIHRLTRLERSKAILREHVVDQLNKLFKRLNMDAKISISGIPTVKLIDDALNKMSIGEIGLDKVRELTKI